MLLSWRQKKVTARQAVLTELFHQLASSHEGQDALTSPANKILTSSSEGPDALLHHCTTQTQLVQSHNTPELLDIQLL